MIPADPFHFDTLVWKWRIATYLFLVGVSVGSVVFAILVKRQLLGKEANRNGIVKAAAILGPVAVASGLVLLIFDLARWWMFWTLLVFYKLNSIMSIGVILFQTYMPLVILWILIVFQSEALAVRKWLLGDKLTFVDGLIRYVAKFERIIEALLFINCLALGAYTGFLLAALKSYPMLNNPVLPVLFLISGLSSGVAATTAMAITVFKEDTHNKALAFIHRFELPLVFFELFLFFCLFVGLYYGGGQKAASLVVALGTGFWANVFWYGVLGLGIVVPLAIRFLHPSGQHAKMQMLLTCICSLCGIFMLRFYILYAGQITVI